MSLRLVPLQLSLFRLLPTLDVERAERNGHQWLRSVLDYLEWRSGMGWSRGSNRHTQDRLEYLDAIRLVNSVMADAPSPYLKKPVDVAPPPSSRPAPLFEGKSRSQIVAELMELRPEFTNKKLLLSLKREKLARMLSDAQNKVPLKLGWTA